MSLTLASLLAAVVAILGSIAFAATRALRLWRDGKRLLKAFGESSARIERSAALAEVHLSRASASGERLTASMERLARSRASLNVLLAALASARATFTRFGAAVPRK